MDIDHAQFLKKFREAGMVVIDKRSIAVDEQIAKRERDKFLSKMKELQSAQNNDNEQRAADKAHH